MSRYIDNDALAESMELAAFAEKMQSQYKKKKINTDPIEIKTISKVERSRRKNREKMKKHSRIKNRPC